MQKLKISEARILVITTTVLAGLSSKIAGKQTVDLHENTLLYVL